MTEKKTHGGPGRGQGRKPLGDVPLDTKFLVPMSTAQREKVKRLGGSVWVRRKINEAKEP